MVYTVSITSQGQISIPAPIRASLGLNEYKKALIRVDKKRIVIEPVDDFFSLEGSLKTKKPPLSSKKIHEMFAEYLANETVNNS